MKQNHKEIAGIVPKIHLLGGVCYLAQLFVWLRRVKSFHNWNKIQKAQQQQQQIVQKQQ